MTTDTDLRAAVAEITRRAGYRSFHFSDFGSSDMDDCIAAATILNAVASGDLVLKADVVGLVGALDFAVVNSRLYGVTPSSKGAQVWHDNAVGSVARAALTAWESRK